MDCSELKDDVKGEWSMDSGSSSSLLLELELGSFS